MQLRTRLNVLEKSFNEYQIRCLPVYFLFLMNKHFKVKNILVSGYKSDYTPTQHPKFKSQHPILARTLNIYKYMYVYDIVKCFSLH
jgi:hypothetical protein